MPRAKSPSPNVKVHISVPQDVDLKIRALLFTAHYQNGFEKGAYSDLVVKALREYLARNCAEVAPQ